MKRMLLSTIVTVTGAMLLQKIMNSEAVHEYLEKKMK